MSYRPSTVADGAVAVAVDELLLLHLRSNRLIDTL